MRLQINIESAGARVGSGPITTASRWTNTRRLDRAGTFSFTMPGDDPQRALCTAKRVARCYALTDGNAPLEIGAGVIDSQSLRVGPDGVTAEISGDDMLRELTYRSVGFLGVSAASTRAPDQIKHNNDPAGANTFTDKTPAFTLTLTADDFLYIGDADPFETVTLNLGATVNAVEAALTLEYWNGAAWQDIDMVDGTATTGKPWKQDGAITFERLLNWATCAVDGDTMYWVRIQPDHDLTATIDFTTVTITHIVPTDTGLHDIMLQAPAGWTLINRSGLEETTNSIYAQFGGESVLAALVKVAEATGEHFILVPGRGRFFGTALPTMIPGCVRSRTSIPLLPRVMPACCC